MSDILAPAPVDIVSERSSGVQPDRREVLVSALASVLVVIASAVGIVSTYDQMSQTWDEPFHIAAGLEWLQDGTYRLQTENPLLGRLSAAIGAYLAGARLPPHEQRATEALIAGKQALYDGGQLQTRLTAARAGELPFFCLTAALIWMWLRQEPVPAFLAVAAFATLPPILAHSGLATSDIAFIAMFMVVVLAFRSWIERPDNLRSVSLGVALGLALATKFTTIQFFAATVVGLLGAGLVRTRERRREFLTVRLSRAAFVIAPTTIVVVWAVFGFSTGRLSDFVVSSGPQGIWIIQGPDAKGIMGWLSRVLADSTIPAPEFLHGLMFLSAHNYAGHESYALGHVSQFGHWYSYPLGILVKSPLPFLILFVGAVTILVSRRRSLQWSTVGVVATTFFGLIALLPSRVNIGTRHVFLLYPLMAITIGHGIAVWIKEKPARTQVTALTLAALLSWQVVDVWRYHPAGCPTSTRWPPGTPVRC